jgi:hypothetical protein
MKKPKERPLASLTVWSFASMTPSVQPIKLNGGTVTTMIARLHDGAAQVIIPV